jgi:hypothetical protein
MLTQRGTSAQGNNSSGTRADSESSRQPHAEALVIFAAQEFPERSRVHASQKGAMQ